MDFTRVRDMFVEDAVAFGSKVEMVTTLDVLEAEQWRAVWPTMEDYRYDLATLEVIVSPDRLMAVGAAIFRSTGFHEDGSRFERPGRVTASLMRTGHRRAVDRYAYPCVAEARNASAIVRETQPHRSSDLGSGS